MRFRLQMATAVLSVSATSATAAQAGGVEWARRRGESSSRQELAFAAGLGVRVGAAGDIVGARNLRRPCPSGQHQRATPVQMQLNAEDGSESMDFRRRSVTRSLFSDTSKEMSGWMTTLRNLDGPEMPFDEMVEVWSDTERSISASGGGREGNRQKTLNNRYKHFDLRVRGRLQQQWTSVSIPSMFWAGRALVLLLYYIEISRFFVEGCSRTTKQPRQQQRGLGRSMPSDPIPQWIRFWIFLKQSAVDQVVMIYHVSRFCAKTPPEN